MTDYGMNDEWLCDNLAFPIFYLFHCFGKYVILQIYSNTPFIDRLELVIETYYKIIIKIAAILCFLNFL